jgi:uncharacterized protein (TIGR03546 family)
MIFWTIKQLKKLLKILGEGQTPKQIAGGFAFGALIGLAPFNYLYSFFIFFLILIININITSALFSIVISRLLSGLFDSLAHKIGVILLVKIEILQKFWTALYNMPIIPYTNFNNTVMMGSIVISLILFIPIYFFMKWFVVFYRKNLRAKIENLKIVKLLKMSKLAELFRKATL